MSEAEPVAGVQFPVDGGGRRSTTGTNQAVLAAAVRPVDPELAEAMRGQADWRRHYGPYLVRLVSLALERGAAAVEMVGTGLDAVHGSFRFHRGGEEMTPREAMARYDAPFYATAAVEGRASGGPTCGFPTAARSTESAGGTSPAGLRGRRRGFRASSADRTAASRSDGPDRGTGV